MIKEAVATGATIEEAQQAATLMLDAPISAEIQFEILTMPEKKVFGLFGGKQAEVRAYYEAPDEKKPEKKVTGKSEKKAEKKAEKKTSVPKAEKKEAVVVEKEAAPKEKVEEAACPETVVKAYNYLKTIVNGIGITQANIDIFKAEKEFFFEISSEEDYSILIGRRGETLDSIQYLVRLVANRGKDEDEFSKISVNIGNYRQKREVTLKEIARKTAGKVKRYGRSIALDPMNPFERRIIHTEIAEIEDVISYSVGSDAERKVVIALAEGATAQMPRKSYGNGGRGYNNRGRGSRGSRAPRESAAVTSSPSRAPRSDAEGLSRYGKIEPKEN